MAPTIERRVRKLYWEGKQYVDDYLAGVDHGELKNLGALCANWAAVSVAVTTLICLFALGQAGKGVLTTWYLFVSAVALSSCVFTMTIFGYCRGYCKRTLEQLEARAKGGPNAADPKKLKVCGQCDAPFANQRTNPAGNRWICASCGMISRKPKLATREELDRSKAAGERASSSSADRSPRDSEIAAQEAEERRQAVKQTKDLRRRHAREIKEAREAADREEREEIARLIEEERHRVMTARAEEELERRRVEEEERAKREEEEEAAARCAAEEEMAAAKAKAKAKAAEGTAERAAAMTRRHTSLTKIPAPRPINIPPPIPPPAKQQQQQQQQQQQRAAVPLVAAAKVGAAPVPARPPATPRSSAPATPSTPDFDPPLPPMRPMQPPAAAAAWGGAVAAGGSPHAPVSPHASTSPTASFVAGRSPAERSPPPPPGGRSPPGFDPLLGVPESRRSWPGGALGGLGMGAAGIRGILDGEEEVAAVPVAPPPPPGPPPGYAVGGAPPLPAGPPPNTAQRVGIAAPGQPPLPPMPHPSQIKAAAAAEKGGNPRAFLASLELAAYAPVFDRERITLADISLLTEPDLERLGLPLGPRRRILAAIAGVNIGTPGGGTSRQYHLPEQPQPVVPPGMSAVVAPNPFRVARTSSVDGDAAGAAGATVPAGGVSGWNGGGFGGGLFGGFAPSAPSAEQPLQAVGPPGPTVPTVATAPTYNHSRQRSRSTDSDALAMDTLENDLMALTGGLNLDDDDDDDLGLPPPIVEANTGDGVTIGTTDTTTAPAATDGSISPPPRESPPGTPPKPPSHSALDSLDANGVPPTDAATNKHAHAQQHREATDPPKPPSEMMVKAAARLRAAAAAGHPIPNEFVDCITCEVMVDPVIAWDGHTYERDPIARWLQRHSTSPMTGETLPDFTLRPNHSMRSQIINYGEKLAREGGH